MSRRVLRSSIPSLVLLLLLTATGCGDSTDGGDEAAPSPSPTSSSSVATTVPDPTPTVEPADGPWLEVPNARLRVPKGWYENAALGWVVSWGHPRRTAFTRLSLVPIEDTSLDGVARAARRRLPPGSKRLEDVTVAGGTLSAVHLTGRDGRDLVDTYGMVNLGGAWLVTFSFPWDAVLKKQKMSKDERLELIDSVLATFEIIYKE